MKSRTVLLPMAFALPALISTVPQSAPALASGPIVAQQNPLVGELDTVVAGAFDTSVLLAAQVAVVTPKLAGTTQGRHTCPVSYMSSASKQKNIKLGTTPPTGVRLPTPAPVKKSNPTTHKP